MPPKAPTITPLAVVTILRIGTNTSIVDTTVGSINGLGI